jgi:hypothetical protein
MGLIPRFAAGRRWGDVLAGRQHSGSKIFRTGCCRLQLPAIRSCLSGRMPPVDLVELMGSKKCSSSARASPLAHSPDEGSDHVDEVVANLPVDSHVGRGSPPHEADCHGRNPRVAAIGNANSTIRLALAMQNGGMTMSEYQLGLLAGLLAAQALLAGCAHEHLETAGNGQTQEWVKPQPAASPVAMYAIPLIEPKGTILDCHHVIAF